VALGWAPTPPFDDGRWLRGPERKLFLQQADADRRHAVRVACRLLAAGHSDDLLIRAALLHDVGKSGVAIRVWHRVGWVLAGRLRTRLTVVGAFRALANHPSIGAARLRSIGADPRLVGLVGGHPLPGDEERGRLLAWADDSV
jgi:hypothetical protein